jgi:hypothetical protein
MHMVWYWQWVQMQMHAWAGKLASTQVIICSPAYGFIPCLRSNWANNTASGRGYGGTVATGARQLSVFLVGANNNWLSTTQDPADKVAFETTSNRDFQLRAVATDRYGMVFMCTAGVPQPLQQLHVSCIICATTWTSATAMCHRQLLTELRCMVRATTGHG